MPRKGTVGAGLGRRSSALLADGLGTPFELEGIALNIEMLGIASAEDFGKPKIRLAEPTYAEGGLRQIYVPRPIEIKLKGIKSAEAFGRPEIRLDLDIQSIQSAESFGQPEIGISLNVRSVRSIGKFGSLVVVPDKRFIENLEEEEALTLFLLAA